MFPMSIRRRFKSIRAGGKKPPGGLPARVRPAPRGCETEKMKKDVLISIRGVQLVDGEKECIELLTTGRYYKKNGSYYLSYLETEATGMEGIRTTLHIEDSKRVTMLRSGRAKSQLIIEKGCRHQCHYDTGYGSIMVGVLGDRIDSRLSDEGGVLDFSYSLDINTALASENRVTITVRDAAPPPAPVQ